MKKANELSTLCGVEVCAIIYGENHGQAEVWPSAIGLERVLHKFENLSELKRNKNMVDLYSFWMQRIEKAKEKYEKAMMENKKAEMTNFIRQFIHTRNYNIGDLSLNDINYLTTLINDNMKEVDQRLDSMVTQADEQVVNGAEAIKDGDLLASTNIAQVPLSGGDTLNNMDEVVDTHGYETNMNYGLQSDEQLPMDFLMPPFDDFDFDFDPNGFGSI
ncbi:putative transcription factor MADS-type1 family [Medicago truncatula]|nr:agamous-like MADS-box protein AGL80 [Medicago truncatula]RHN67779.1 putative transcription factor MADS-type1 family [Medicago truncatula]